MLVYKTWTHVANRTFLIEAVPMPNLTNALSALPWTASANTPSARTIMADRDAWPPARGISGSTNRIKLAAARFNGTPGVLLDYTTVNAGLNNYTFPNGATYFVSGYVSLTGTTYFQSGAVIKFTNDVDAQLAVDGALICDTSPTNLAYLTSMDDNSLGQSIAGSSGSPAITGAEYINIITDTVGKLQNLYFAYAADAVQADNEAVWNSQFLDCGRGILLWHNVSLYNDLFAQCTYALDPIYGGVILGENLTVDGNLLDGWGTTLCITNCILHGNATANIIDADAHVSEYNEYVTGITTMGSPPYFKTGAGGNYYLIDNTYRDAGTTNIDPALYAELRTMTTYAPQDGSNPDNDSKPDLGYHYPYSFAPIGGNGDYFTAGVFK